MKTQRFKLMGALVILGVLCLGSFSPVNAQPMAQIEVHEGKVNVNTATFDELLALKGVGPAIAARIVEYREEYGLFESAEDLSYIRGIGGKKLQDIKAQIAL